jgi:hypothetical protein
MPLRVRVLTLLLLSLLGTAALAADFRFATVMLSQVDNNVVLDADIQYALNDTTSEALDNGVPLTFVTHIEVRDADAWIWQGDLVDRRLRSTLRYHPLSGLYQLHQLDSDRIEQFATRAAAIQALGTIRGLALLPTSRLKRGTSYKVRLNTYLDLEALPLPLRPLAVLTPSWHLESDQWERPLTP